MHVIEGDWRLTAVEPLAAEWNDDAELRHCSAHGVRKASAARAAENGATTHQLMAMF